MSKRITVEEIKKMREAKRKDLKATTAALKKGKIKLPYSPLDADKLVPALRKNEMEIDFHL